MSQRDAEAYVDGRHSLVCCHSCGHVNLRFDGLDERCERCGQYHSYAFPDEIVGILDGFLITHEEVEL